MATRPCDGRDPQGAVARAVGRPPRDVDVGRPALRHGGGLLLPDRHPGGTPRIFAGAASSWIGPQVATPTTSAPAGSRTRRGIRFPEDTGGLPGARLAAAAGPGDDVVWAGTEPGAVFRSEDRGRTFELVRALWDHPQRQEWGAGFGGQAFHTLLPHPSDPESVTVAISTGGVYRTTDGGDSWAPRNQGIRAEFLPEGQQYPEFGQCVHKVARHPARPERLFLQNHGGVYRTDDGGGSWASIAEGLPTDFGFPSWSTRTTPRPSGCSRLAGADGRFPLEGSALCGGPATPATPGSRWEASARACPSVLRRRDARRDVRGRPRPGRGLLRRPQRQRLGSSTTARAGSWCATCPTCWCVRAGLTLG